MTKILLIAVLLAGSSGGTSTTTVSPEIWLYSAPEEPDACQGHYRDHGFYLRDINRCSWMI